MNCLVFFLIPLIIYCICHPEERALNMFSETVTLVLLLTVFEANFSRSIPETANIENLRVQVQRTSKCMFWVTIL